VEVLNSVTATVWIPKLLTPWGSHHHSCQLLLLYKLIRITAVYKHHFTLAITYYIPRGQEWFNRHGLL